MRVLKIIVGLFVVALIVTAIFEDNEDVIPKTIIKLDYEEYTKLKEITPISIYQNNTDQKKGLWSNSLTQGYFIYTNKDKWSSGAIKAFPFSDYVDEKGCPELFIKLVVGHSNAEVSSSSSKKDYSPETLETCVHSVINNGYEIIASNKKEKEARLKAWEEKANSKEK